MAVVVSAACRALKKSATKGRTSAGSPARVVSAACRAKRARPDQCCDVKKIVVKVMSAACRAKEHDTRMLGLERPTFVVSAACRAKEHDRSGGARVEPRRGREPAVDVGSTTTKNAPSERACAGLGSDERRVPRQEHDGETSVASDLVGAACRVEEHDNCEHFATVALQASQAMSKRRGPRQEPDHDVPLCDCSAAADPLAHASPVA